MTLASALLRSVLALALLPWLAACATRPPVDAPSGAGIGGSGPQGWFGRFAVSTFPVTENAAEERASGRFVLRRLAGASVLEISSALGQTMAVARTDASGARLETASGDVYTAPSVEVLLERAFGWRIPVTYLPEWLEGRFEHPVEFAPDDPRRPVAAVSGGWRVRVDEFRGSRPRRIALHWPDPPEAGARRLALLLVIDGREER